MIPDFNKEEIESFAVVVSTFIDKAEAKFQKPTMGTLAAVVQIWNSRAIFGEDKKVTIYLKNPQVHKEKIIDMFKNMPSILLHINGQLIPNDSIIKTDSTNYYEGTVKSMLIFNKLTKSKYIGSVKSLTELEPHGNGIKIEMIGTKDQVIYRGDFVEGKKHGFGSEERKYQLYEGYWENNEKHGWGTQLVKRKKRATEKNEQTESSQKSEKYRNEKCEDDRSDGDFKQQQQQDLRPKKKGPQKNEEDPKSKAEFSEQKKKQLLKVYRSVYKGPFQKGSKSGADGVEFNKHGSYKGDWVAGAKTGFGIMKYKGGAEYEGEWRNNVIEGKGKYVDEGKNIYEGQFENGVFEGEGVMTYSNGDVYSGSWSKGRKHGMGVYTYKDQDYYDGEWVKDAAEGQGTLMVNGVFFEGQFSKGMKQGLGEETSDNGDIIKGVWDKNKLKDTISINGVLCNEQAE